ncbi:MAG: M23 family metallopeptidase [Spirochaetia bacterium]
MGYPRRGKARRSRSLADLPVAVVRLTGSFLAKIGTTFVTLGAKKFTIMLIPHTHRPGVSVQLNAIMLSLLVVLLSGLVFAFFYLTTVYSGSARAARERAEGLDETERQLNSVVTEIEDAMRLARAFDSTLQDTLAGLDMAPPGRGREISSALGGDLGADMTVDEVNPNEPVELQTVRRLVAMVDSAVEPIDSLAGVLRAQKDLLADLPNFWPIKGGRGRVTMEFGPNVHPITDQWYIHKGFNIADALGVPVVSAANGKVSEIGFDPTYGLYVWVRHRYGFRTRYAHLQSISVSEGQQVIQGERLGALGNTGLATGPRLYFQIWLGTDVVDPAGFLKMAGDFGGYDSFR